MRVGVDVRHLASQPLTGVGVVTRDLVTAIATAMPRDEIKIFYNGATDAPDFVSSWATAFENVILIERRIPNRLFDLGARVAKLPKLDRLMGGIDVLFSPHALLAPLERASRVIVLHDLSFVVHPEYYTPRSLAWHARTGMRAQARSARAIVVPSRATARDVERLWSIPRERISVVPWGMPSVCGQGTDDRHKHKEYRTILCLGTIGKRKNQRVLIEALALLRIDPKFQDVRIRLVGNLGWGSDEVIRLGKLLLPPSALIIDGYAPEPKKAEYLAEASIFVYPSMYEGAALPVLEAMRAGIPVVASERTAIPETTGSATILLDPSRPAVLASAIENILNDDGLRNELIRKGREQIKRFDWNKSAEQVAEIIRAIYATKEI